MKERTKGFFAGLLAATLILGLGGGALAASRTITVEDGISVTINGVPFSPKSADGSDAPLFAYNGVTYAPVRAFANAAGLNVGYDSDTLTARIETAEYTARTDPNSAGYITAERAREIALADAAVTAEEAVFLKSILDWEDGKAVYEVEFAAGTTEYDYEIDAATGAILDKDLDCEDFDWSRRDSWHNYSGLFHTDDHPAAPADRITEARAREIALDKLSGGTVTECELDYEDGRWIYELELTLGRTEYECEIDALTGAVLKWERD